MTQPVVGPPRRAILLASLGVAAVGGASIWALTQRPDPVFIRLGGDSPLLGQPLPGFALPGLAPREGFASTEIASLGQPLLINFFASWCGPCLQELPVLQQLAQRGVPIWGVDYRDQPDAAAAFLRQHGDPYRRVGMDAQGQAAHRLGLMGVPETYFLDRAGIVRWHWAGGLSPDVVAQRLDPLLRAAA